MRLKTPLALVVTMSLLTACGGTGSTSKTSDSAESATSPEVGTYELTTEIIASNLDGEDDRVGATDRNDLILSCADDACATLHLRTGAAKGALSRAYLLTRSDDGLSGRGVREGPCTESSSPDEPGRFTETVTFALRVDGTAITGTHEYAFTGCGFDAEASSKDVGTRIDDRARYLATDQVTAVATPLGTYDAAVDAIYTKANSCLGQPDSTAATCLLALIEPWTPTFDALESALGGLDSAEGPCKDALAELDLQGLQSSANATVKGLQDEKTRASTYTDDVSPLVSLITKEHEKLVTALALCIDPSEIASIGTDGTLAIDVTSSRLPVLSGA